VRLTCRCPSPSSICNDKLLYIYIHAGRACLPNVQHLPIMSNAIMGDVPPPAAAVADLDDPPKPYKTRWERLVSTVWDS
jgi:hypothetical protein